MRVPNTAHTLYPFTQNSGNLHKIFYLCIISMNPRGMPDVSLRPETEEALSQAETKESKNAKEVESQAIFQKSNVNMDIKPVEDLAPKEEAPPPAPTKPKKKLTEKQLEALKRGREKSIATRRAKKEEKEKAKSSSAPKNHIETLSANGQQPPTAMSSQMPQTINITPSQPSFNIDYDKIISGVSDRMMTNSRQSKRNDRHSIIDEEQPENVFDKEAFEKQIRENERQNIYTKMVQIEKEKTEKRNQATAKKVLEKQPQSVNPYAYAFNMGARSRYNRY